MTDLPPLSTLMEALRFDAAALALNRRQLLSDDQRSRLQKVQQRTLLIAGGIFILLAFVAALTIYMGQRNQQIFLSAVGVGVTMLNAVMIGFTARSYLRLAADLREQQPVIIHEGLLKRVLRPNGQVNNYVLQLGTREFSVDKDTFRQFRHEQLYAFYATQHANVLLSAEALPRVQV